MRNSHESANHPDRYVVHSSPLHHGIALWPPPSTDPKDPLRWPYWAKIVSLCAVALCNFTANFAGAGFAVTTPVLQAQFHKSAAQVNTLLTFNFLLLGIGNMIFVPVATKLGKRFSLLVSLAMLFAILCWTAEVKTFKGLLAARCVSGFASAAGESIVPGIVADLFFLHERAAMMSVYVILVSGATAIGPLLASFIMQYSPETWRTFAWVCAALSGFNLLAVFFLYPESSFVRPVHYEVSVAPEEKITDKEAHVECLPRTDVGLLHVDPVPMQWSKIWRTIWTVNENVDLIRAFCQPFVFLLYPHVLWTVFMYGCSLAGQIILIFAFPSLLLAPPYLFKTVDVGLIQLAAIIGFILATFAGGYFSDIITARQIRKAGGTVWPEQRLISLIPGCFVAPAGCILTAFACGYELHWIAIAFGFGMLSFGTIYGPNIAITYVVESHPEFASDCLVVVNVFKNIVAFIFLYVAVTWVQTRGWIQVYMIMFMLVTLAYLLAIPVYFYGEKLRNRSKKLTFRDRE